MNRDSHVLWITVFAAFAASLSLQPELLEHLLELDKKAIVSVICQLLAIVAAQLGTSPLKGKND